MKNVFKCLLLVLLPCVCLAQKDDFEREVEGSNISFTKPTGFIEFDFRTKVFVDSSRFNYKRYESEWEDKLYCKGGSILNSSSLTLVNSDSSVFIWYSILKYEGLNKYNLTYETALANGLKVTIDTSYAECVTKYKANFLKRKYNADDGGTYCHSSKCQLPELRNLKIVYLAKKGTMLQREAGNYGSYVEIRYQYKDKIKPQIDDIIENTSSSIKFK